MSTANTPSSFGSVARVLHWLTALLILTAIPLGLYANSLPFDTSEALAAKAQVFSLHKTLGVAAFFVALARILWAFTQPRPAPLHPERRLETFAAEAVHWALYLSLVAVPLSGWVHHAATTGFAPILWPFGDRLPFVPQSESVSHAASVLHWLFSKLLIASLVLHIAGAVKHAVIDRDATLARMTKGVAAGSHAAHAVTPALAALVIYLAGAATALSLSPQPQPVEATPAATEQVAAQAETTGNWQVTTGSLSFVVKQMGSDVSGTFPNWNADITFTTDATDNHVRVEIDTTSLELGSVTEQARSVDFFDVATHPTAVFEADILPATTGYEAKGTLTLLGLTKPVTLPFTLEITGDTAKMAGTLTLDRREFEMGRSFDDEASVGFNVQVDVELTAQRK